MGVEGEAQNAFFSVGTQVQNVNGARHLPFSPGFAAPPPFPARPEGF